MIKVKMSRMGDERRLVRRRQLLVGLALLVAAWAGCGTSAQKRDLAALAADAPAEPSGIEKDALLSRSNYQRAAEAKLADLSGRIAKLKSISNPRGPDLSGGLRREVAALEEKRATAEQKLFTLKLAPEHEWLRFREEVDTALYDLERHYLSIVSR